MQEARPTESGFNFLIIDFSSKRQKTLHFEWRNGIYSPTNSGEWIPLLRNSQIVRNPLENNNDFEAFLVDVGTGFTHPRKRELVLRDVFVYPDLKEEQFDKKLEGKDATKSISGEQIIKYVCDNPNLVIVGARESGKTTLGKILYDDFRKRGLYPLFVRSRQVSGVNEEQFWKSVQRAFGQQYDLQNFDHYRQLAKDERLLIVDNFHKCRFNAEGQNKFLHNAKQLFGTIVLFAYEVFHLEVLAGSKEADSLKDFRHCSLRPLGYLRRKHLIENWLRLGREFTISTEELAEERASFEKIINGIIGKNLVPSYPVLVLSILQIAEATKSHNIGAGSEGYIYEALITEALARISKKPSDLDKIYAFLSHLAYNMFENERDVVSHDEILELSEAYFERFGIRFENIDELLLALEQTGILRLSDGCFRFHPSYYYFYFVARYFRENLSDPRQAKKLRAKTFEMADTVYFEEYAQILIFLIYLTKDPELIERIRNNAALIYSEFRPCNLDSDLGFINRIASPLPDRQLPDTTPESNIEEHHRRLDDYDEEEFSQVNRKSGKIKYADDIDDIVKLNIAFKTMELMGQILRNFPYHLVAETKEEIVKECELLGLRTLSAIIGIAGRNMEEAKDYYREVIKERRAFMSQAQADLEAANFVYWLMSAIGYGIVKKISHSVGAEELSHTFRRVLDSLEPRLSVRMIDVSVRLDHFRGTPMAEIESLAKDCKATYIRSHFCGTW